MNCKKIHKICAQCTDFGSTCYHMSQQREIEALKRQIAELEDKAKELKVRRKTQADLSAAQARVRELEGAGDKLRSCLEYVDPNSESIEEWDKLTNARME